MDTSYPLLDRGLQILRSKAPLQLDLCKCNPFRLVWPGKAECEKSPRVSAEGQPPKEGQTLRLRNQ